MNIPKFEQATKLAGHFENKLNEINLQTALIAKIRREIENNIISNHCGQWDTLTDIRAIPRMEYDRLSKEWEKYMDAFRRANALGMRALSE